MKRDFEFFFKTDYSCHTKMTTLVQIQQKNTSMKCEICLKVTLKTQELHQSTSLEHLWTSLYSISCKFYNLYVAVILTREKLEDWTPVCGKCSLYIEGNMLFHTKNPTIFEQKNKTRVSKISFVKQILLANLSLCSVFEETM